MKRFSITRVMVFEYLLREGELSGYAFMKYCRKIGIPVSSGMLYPCLRELKEKEMIIEKQDGRKKVYTLSEKGRAFVERARGKRSVDQGFQEMLFRFMYHLEKVDWKKKDTVSFLLEDVRRMEGYLERILGKKGEENG
ncbi:MAG: PadR family transcriptional regulator [Candidatus Atribacteria bacterium]|nr:PadR family transcriptional regulator [Candidatus Atribacteria bacterium]